MVCICRTNISVLCFWDLDTEALEAFRLIGKPFFTQEFVALRGHPERYITEYMVEALRILDIGFADLRKARNLPLAEIVGCSPDQQCPEVRIADPVRYSRFCSSQKSGRA